MHAAASACIFLPYYVLLNCRDRVLNTWGRRTTSTDSSSWMYLSQVYHSRSKPVHHSFTYDVRMALIDLDAPPTWYDSCENDTMTAQQARKLSNTRGKVRLLTHPSVAGYRQNPISVYYCYDESNTKLEMCIAEVTNTPWGDRVTFLFRPDGEHVPKSLHVSPLMDMQNTWCLKTKDPYSDDENNKYKVQPGGIFVQVSVSHPEKGDYFCAILKGELDGVEPHRPNERAGFRTLFRYGFQPQRIALWIYWHALLLLRKGVPFYSPPSLSVCQAAESKATHPVLSNGCPCLWRPAQEWPWALTHPQDIKASHVT